MQPNDTPGKSATTQAPTTGPKGAHPPYCKPLAIRSAGEFTLPAHRAQPGALSQGHDQSQRYSLPQLKAVAKLDERRISAMIRVLTGASTCPLLGVLVTPTVKCSATFNLLLQRPLGRVSEVSGKRCSRDICGSERSDGLFETPRLVLRRWRADDVVPMAAFNADPEVMRWIGDGSVRDEQQTRREVEAMEREWDRQGFGLFAMEIRSTGEQAGSPVFRFPTSCRSSCLRLRLAGCWGVPTGGRAWPRRPLRLQAGPDWQHRPVRQRRL